MAKDKPPLPSVYKTGKGLAPLTMFDAEQLDGFPLGTEFELRCLTKRSWPQLKTYWKALGLAVKATGRWQSPEALHVALKVKLGHTVPIFDLKGNVAGMIPNSAALDAMDHAEFMAFFNAAMEALAEAIGADPLAWMEAA